MIINIIIIVNTNWNYQQNYFIIMKLHFICIYMRTCCFAKMLFARLVWEPQLSSDGWRIHAWRSTNARLRSPGRLLYLMETWALSLHDSPPKKPARFLFVLRRDNLIEIYLRDPPDQFGVYQITQIPSYGSLISLKSCLSRSSKRSDWPNPKIWSIFFSSFFLQSHHMITLLYVHSCHGDTRRINAKTCINAYLITRSYDNNHKVHSLEPGFHHEGIMQIMI